MRSIPLAILLFCAAPLPAAVTLPLEGYFRIGRFMPVEVSGRDTAALSGRGILTTRIAVPRDASVVVPVLVLDEDVDPARFPRPLRELGENERLVGLIGVEASEVQWLFPEQTVIAIPLDLARPLPGPAAAWEVLDAVVCAGPIPGADALHIPTLLGSGVTFAVRSPAAPDARYPWQQEEAWWVLRHRPAGPVGAIDGDVYAPVWNWSPGVPGRARWVVLLIGVLISIGALAATLPRSRRAQVGALAGVTGVAIIGIAAWTQRQPRVSTIEGGVLTVVAPIVQHDLWQYQTAGVVAELKFPTLGNTRPMLMTPAQAERQRVTLECDADGHPLQITARIDPGQKLACMSRMVVPLPPDLRSTARANEAGSPMQALVRAAYLGPGMKTLGQVPSEDGQTWPSVVLERDR